MKRARVKPQTQGNPASKIAKEILTLRSNIRANKDRLRKHKIFNTH